MARFRFELTEDAVAFQDVMREDFDPLQRMWSSASDRDQVLGEAIEEIVRANGSELGSMHDG
jgi:hypothetical protein